MENNQNLQPKETLYLHLLSASLEDNFSVFYKIDSSSEEEANFNQKPKRIPTKTPANLPHIGFGSAICDSILYLFGGWVDDTINLRKEACYLDLVAASSNKLVPLQYIKHEMNVFRAFPTTVTIGKKIYIFGSQYPGYGEFPSEMDPTTWAEVFNTEDKLFKLITPPPFTPSTSHRCIGVVAALIGKNKILIATDNFSDLFIYDVETDQWTPLPRDDEVVSPFRLCSMRSPVIGNYIFLYGSGKICAFDIDKNQFLKNNISLLEYTFFDNEEVILNGVIHHRGGWKFSVVFGDDGGYLVRFVYVVSFEIENPECCGELKVKAGTMNIVDHVVRGDTFIDSFLWSNQTVPLGNTSNGKQSLKSNLIVGGSSVTTHVDDDCMMDSQDCYEPIFRPGGSLVFPYVDASYAAVLRQNNQSLFRRKLAKFSKLLRKEAALDKEMFEMRLEMNFLIAEMRRRVEYGDGGSDTVARLQSELSSTTLGECVKNENILGKNLLEDISSTKKKVKAQLIKRDEMMHLIDRAQRYMR